ncbi:MAG: fibronectin type III domain-containing protein [Acidobacteriota bacterium]
MGRACVCAAILSVAWAPAACGKKGPPLAPIVKTPAVPADFSAVRSGDTVYVRFTAPIANTDRTTPADLSRVEVYAYTAIREIEGLEVRDMTLVADVLVRRPPDPEDDRDAKDQKASAKKPAKPKPVEPGVDQGTIVTITETLTPETMAMTVLRKRWIPKPAVVIDAPDRGSTLAPPAVGPMTEPGPRRFYLAYTVNHRGERGTPSLRVAVAFDPPPPAPGKPWLAVKDKTVEVSWDPPVGSAFTVDQPAAGLLAWSTDLAVLLPPLSLRAAAPPVVRLDEKDGARELVWDPAPPTVWAAEKAAPFAPLAVTTRGVLLPVLPSYNVYLVAQAPAAPVAPPPASLRRSAKTEKDAIVVAPPNLPLPLNEKPLAVTTFVDEKAQFGVERCYQVRTLNTAGVAAQLPVDPTAKPLPGVIAPATAAIIESLPSEMACVTPTDTVPPPAPTGLAAVSSTGAISLIWTGVEASDLAGYLVLRSSTPDGELTPLNAKPVRETTYRDTNVRSGARYWYAVVAVDTATPANRSPKSNIVQETAR